MTWSVDPPTPDRPYVRVTLRGAPTADEVALSFETSTKTCVEHDVFLVLGDTSRMVGGHTVVDLFPLVTALSEMRATQRFREALIAPAAASMAEKVRFWETAGVNRGLNIRTFPDEAAAIEWLLS